MQIRHVESDEFDAAARLFADAFLNDPGWVAVGPDRAGHHQKAGVGGQLGQGLGTQLELGHGLEEPAALGLGKQPAAGPFEPLGDERDQAVIGGSTDIVPVQAVELGEIEAGGRASYGVDVEPFDRLIGRDDFIVAMAPA